MPYFRNLGVSLEDLLQFFLGVTIIGLGFSIGALPVLCLLRMFSII